MAKAVENLVLATTEEFAEQIRDLTSTLGITMADLFRGAVRARLEDPPAVDLESTGLRGERLRVHVDPALKREIVAAARTQGLSTSRWLEAAVCSHLIHLFAVQVAEAKKHAEMLSQRVRAFRHSLHGVEAREGSPTQQALRARARLRVAEAAEYLRHNAHA